MVLPSGDKEARAGSEQGKIMVRGPGQNLEIKAFSKPPTEHRPEMSDISIINPFEGSRRFSILTVLTALSE